MEALTGLFGAIYIVCVLAIFIYILQLLGRAASAIEKAASSLEIITRKPRDDGKP